MILKKRIAVISNHILSPDRIGGMEHFYKRFDTSVKELGHSIDWYMTMYDGFSYLSTLDIVSADGGPVEQQFLTTSQEMRKDYEVIYTHFTALCSPYYKKIAKQFPKAKIIAVDHNPRPIGGFSRTKKFKNLLKSLLYSKYIHVFVAVSNYSKRHLIKDFTSRIKNKITIIHNGIDSGRYVKKTKYKGTTNFIVTSHLRKIKGIQDIIDAVHILPEHLKSNIRVTIYGEGDYEGVLKEKTSGLHLEEQVKFMGSVDDLYKRYADYDYLIHASYGETYCYSVVEALTACVPVITTNDHGNVLGLVENGENGFLFNAGDITELSAILQGVMSKKHTINESTLNDAHISNMNIDSMVNNYIKLID